MRGNSYSIKSEKKTEIEYIYLIFLYLTLPGIFDINLFQVISLVKDLIPSNCSTSYISTMGNLLRIQFLVIRLHTV